MLVYENHEAQVVLLAPTPLVQLLPFSLERPPALIVTLVVLNLQILGVLEKSIGGVILMTILWIRHPSFRSL